MTEILANDKPSLVYFWNNICLKNEEELKKSLNQLPTPKFVKIGKLLNVTASSKEETIPLMVEEIKNLEESMKNDVVKEEVKEEKKNEKKEKKVEEEKVKTIEYPVMQVKINQKYLDLVPRPSEDQQKILMESIKKDGLQEAIEVLDDGTIVDGHSRFQALQELGLLPVPADKLKVLTFNKKSEILEYIFTKNVPRRHLSDIDRISLTKKFLPTIEAIKEEVKKEKAEKISATKRGEKKADEKPAETTREKVAKMAGVTTAQQARYDFLEKWAPEMLEEAKGDNGKALGNIYLKAKEMKSYIEKKMPEVVDQIKEKAISLTDAYNTVLEAHPIQEEEKPLGPKGEVVRDILSMLKKEWIKKYETDQYTLDDTDSRIFIRLDAMFNKFKDAGK